MFILTLLLLSADFYYLKNIAGRRLVGLRWWNEVNVTTGDSHWVFESSDPNTRTIAATDKRFFWLSLYVAPAFWVGLAVLAIIKLSSVIWLSLVGEWLGFTIGKETRELMSYSYRPYSHHHEYGGLLAVRQVQPGVDACESGIRRQHRQRSGGRSPGETFQVDFSFLMDLMLLTGCGTAAMDWLNMT